VSVEPEELGRSGEELAALLKAVRKRSGLTGTRIAARCRVGERWPTPRAGLLGPNAQFR
jgi:hypothetical protein